MKIGDLVKWEGWLGVVMGDWEHPSSHEMHTLVCWLTGRYTGDTDAVLQDTLEVVYESR